MLGILLFSLSAAFPSDSLRMETINGKPFVVHQVGEKETLYSLSKRYGTTVADILTQNPTADAGLEIGQILKIPYGGKPKPASVVQTSNGIVHKVAPKETLFSIARLYNVSVDEIKTWNNLKESTLSTGQEILIRKYSTSQSTEVKTVTATSTATAKTHTVAAKETFYSIGRLYGISVEQIKEWNSLQSNELSIGQVLVVSAPVTGATRQVATVNTATQTVAPVVTTTAVTPKTETITISESISGSDEIREAGLAALIEGTEGSRKYLAQHKSVPPGTILKIRNLANNQEVFVRVTGPATTVDDNVMIWISKSAYDRLGAADKFRAEITYYK